jgi:hypothetical protein
MNMLKITGTLGNISLRKEKEFGFETGVTQFTFPHDGREVSILLKIRSQQLLRMTRRWSVASRIEIIGVLSQDAESGEFFILLQGVMIPKKLGGNNVQVADREIVRTA